MNAARVLARKTTRGRPDGSSMGSTAFNSPAPTAVSTRALRVNSPISSGQWRLMRQRLSSQSVKAHVRAATGLNSPMADLAKELGAEMSVRSALIGPRRIAKELKARQFTDDDADV
jgi:hypothetical protein